MKDIVFITGHEFGLEALMGILLSQEYQQGDINISAIISLDNGQINSTVGFSDVGNIAKQYSIKNYPVTSSNSLKFQKTIHEVNPDFIVCVGWSRLLKSDILDIPKKKNNALSRHSNHYGCIGMHPTLLPIGRGRAPIPWTIINGLNTTGLTTFFLEEEADSGNIIEQTSFNITEDETSTTLFEKIKRLHFLHGLYLSKSINEKNIYSKSFKQDDNSATIWTKRTPKDSQIFFHQLGKNIVSLYKAMTYPYPLSFFVLFNKKYYVKNLSFEKKSHNYELGEVVENKDNIFFIAVLDGILTIHT